MAEDEKSNQFISNVRGFGTKVRDSTNPDTFEPRPLEIGADGALKILPRMSRWRQVATAVLGTSSTVVFVANRAYEDVRVILTNTDTVMRSFRLYLRKGGEAEADTNVRAKDLGIAPGASREYSTGLGVDDTISGLGSTASKITVIVEAREERS